MKIFGHLSFFDPQTVGLAKLVYRLSGKMILMKMLSGNLLSVSYIQQVTDQHFPSVSYKLD